MEQQENSKKRRLIEQNKINKNLTKSVDQSTMTDCGLPMSLTVWTQTEFEEIKPSVASAVEIELREKISKMEEKLKNHTLLLNELTSHKNKNDFITKYKIVSEGPEIQLEPIMVECTGEEVIYYEETAPNENNHDTSSVRYQTSSIQNHNSNNFKQETYSSHSNAKVEINNAKRYEIWNGESHHNTQTTIVPSSATVTSNGSPQNLCTNFRQMPISSQSTQSNNETGSMTTQQFDDYHASNRITRASTFNHNQQYNPRDSPEVSNSSNIPLNQNINNVTSMAQFKSEHNSSMYPYAPENSNSSSNTKPLIKNTSASSSSSPNYSMNSQEYVSIGPNKTRIPAHIFESIDWNSTATATRKLLTSTFDRMTLATHSLTGKPSPAFHDRNRPLKKQLDPKIISDIIFAVSRKCNVAEREVRSAITTKCADENKMFRQRERKQKSDIDKENIVNT